MKLVILIYFVGLALNAKQIYVDIQWAPNNANRVEYTVDPSIKVYEFKNILFQNNGLDYKIYDLVKAGSNGFTILESDNSMGDYGKAPQDPVKFSVVQKSSGLEKEEVAPKEEPKAEEKPAEPTPTKEDEKPKAEQPAEHKETPAEEAPK